MRNISYIESVVPQSDADRDYECIHKVENWLYDLVQCVFAV